MKRLLSIIALALLPGWARAEPAEPAFRLEAPAASGYKYPDHVQGWMGGRVVGSDDPGFVSVRTERGSWTINLGTDTVYLNGTRYDPANVYRFRDGRCDELTMWYAWTGPCQLVVKRSAYHFDSIAGDELGYALKVSDEILATMAPEDRRYHEREDLVFSWFETRLSSMADCRAAWAEWDRTHPNGWDGKPPAQKLKAPARPVPALGTAEPAFRMEPVFKLAGSCPCGNACGCPGGTCGNGCSVRGAAAPSKNPQDACVGIALTNGFASGTAIAGAPKGKTWVVTAAHVVDHGGDRVTHGDKSYPARVLASNRRADVALLEIDADLPTVKLGTVTQGSTVTLKGYGGSWRGPIRGIFDRIRRGRVSQVLGETTWVTIQHGPGDSGAGYLNEAGELVGVLSGGLKDTESSVGARSEQIAALMPGASKIAPQAPVANQPDCPNGRCPLPGSSGSQSFQSGGSCPNGSCGGSVSYGAGQSGGSCGTAVSRGGFRGRQPVLRVNGGPGVLRSVFGGRCR